MKKTSFEKNLLGAGRKGGRFIYKALVAKKETANDIEERKRQREWALEEKREPKPSCSPTKRNGKLRNRDFLGREKLP